jgi:murein DD-endopeptidase MepM/ murein hydrolase activator NlpD
MAKASQTRIANTEEQPCSRSRHQRKGSSSRFFVAQFRKFCFLLFVTVLAAAYCRDQFGSVLNPLPLRESLAPVAALQLLAEPPDRFVLMPVAGIRIRQVANTWHAARVGHKHEGQDIFARKGTPVYSATDGIVLRVGDAGIGGNAVFVLGAGGRVYYYAHLSRFADHLSVGERVTPDSLLGYVGNTGNARTTPAHLHFGVYGSAGAINPLTLLSDRPTGANPQTKALRSSEGTA